MGMSAGKPYKIVYDTFKDKIVKFDPKLEACIPKTLGTTIGLEFRDPSQFLNSKNENIFQSGMVFNLQVALQNIPLTKEDLEGVKESSPLHKMDTYSLILADTVLIPAQSQSLSESLTKYEYGLSEIGWNLSDESDEENEGGSNENDDDDEEIQGTSSTGDGTSQRRTRTSERQKMIKNSDGLNQAEIE